MNEEVYDQILIAIKGARKIGMDDTEIKKALGLSNISKSDLRKLMKGDYPRLKEIGSRSEDRQTDKLEMNYRNKDNKDEVIGNYRNNIRLFNRLVRKEN